VPRLEHLDVDDLLTIATHLRDAETSATCMEDVARRVVELLDACLEDDAGDPACALVRFYVTQRFADLGPLLQTAAIEAAPEDVRDGIEDDTRCFTLLATTGRKPEWCDRRRSVGHRAIPLVDEELVARLPMVAGLLSELGLDIGSVVRPSIADRIERHHRRYDVFHVPDAATSPSVPAKDFVREHGVRSAVGLGGVMPSGEMFCVLLFSRVPIDEHVVELLGTLAVTVKAGIVPHTFRVFGSDSG
jgi:two-component system NtrC family sensor kinase